MLSNVLWQNRFGADPSILNRTILLDGQPYTVIGILPPGSAFDRAFNQIWRPLAFEPSNMTRNFHWFGAFARLKQGVSLQQAQREMDVIGARIAREYPDSNKGWGVIVERYSDVIIGPDMRTSLYVLLSATGMVLLIGCANLANLALARGIAREREVAIRSSLGAGRWRLIRQFLTENVLLSVCGGVVGIGIGYATMKYLKFLVPPNSFPREVNVTTDVRVLLFALGISVLTGLLFGMAPALQVTTPELANSMKEGGRGATAGASRRHLRDILVIAEVSLAFMLLVGSGLMIRSFFRLISVDTGFDSSNVLSMSLPMSLQRYPDPVQLNTYMHEIQSAVEAVPGVRETAMTCAPPLQGACYGMPMQVAGRPMVDRANRQGGFYKVVTPSYFHTLGIKLIKGRALSDHDTKGSPPAIVINDRLARRYFPEQDPLGQRILIQQIVPGKTELGPEIAWEVVGVIADEKVNGLNDERSAGVYVSNEQSPVYGMSLIVRAGVDHLTLQNAVTQAIHGVNKDQAISDVQTLEQLKSDARSRSAGSYFVAGVRRGRAVVGGHWYLWSDFLFRRTAHARTGDSRGPGRVHQHPPSNDPVSRAGIACLAGGVIGVAGSLALTRAFATLLYGVGARDPMTMRSVGAFSRSGADASYSRRVALLRWTRWSR